MNALASTFRLAGRRCGAALLALCCSGCQLFGGDPAQANRDRMQARLEEFSQPPPHEQLTEQPYIRGRALVITKRQEPPAMLIEEPHYWVSDEAKELLAQTPEQVVTVVVLNYSKEGVGSYKVVNANGGVGAYREVCELIIIDRSIPAVTHRKTFSGPEPPGATSISHYQTDVTAPVDRTAVQNYILRLPRK